jgi:anti-anti-sigma factor
MAYWKEMEWQVVVDPTTGIRVYRMAGVLTDSRDAPRLIEIVRADLRSDPRPVLLDLTGVELMTSAGVGMVAAIFASAHNAGKEVALTGLNPRTRQILQVVRMLQFIRAFVDEPQALAAHASGGWEITP